MTDTHYIPAMTLIFDPRSPIAIASEPDGMQPFNENHIKIGASV